LGVEAAIERFHRSCGKPKVKRRVEKSFTLAESQRNLCQGKSSLTKSSMKTKEEVSSRIAGTQCRKNHRTSMSSYRGESQATLSHPS